jgi:hypothetical protein
MVAMHSELMTNATTKTAAAASFFVRIFILFCNHLVILRYLALLVILSEYTYPVAPPKPVSPMIGEETCSPMDGWNSSQRISGWHRSERIGGWHRSERIGWRGDRRKQCRCCKGSTSSVSGKSKIAVD